MGIVIGIDARQLEFPGTEIVIGRSPQAQLSLPDDSRLADRHAVMRLVAGRWLIEAQGDAAVRVGDGRPTKVAWLNPGDVIHLTESGPRLTFSPAQKPVVEFVPMAAAAPSPASGRPSPGMKKLAAVLAGSVLVLAMIVVLFVNRGNKEASKNPDKALIANQEKQDKADQKKGEAAPQGDARPGVVDNIEPPVPNAPAKVESAVYVVLAEDPKSKRTSRFGMATAIGPRQLVTTASSVASMLIRGNEVSPNAKVHGMETAQTFNIVDYRLYPGIQQLLYTYEDSRAEGDRLWTRAKEIQESGNENLAKELDEIEAKYLKSKQVIESVIPMINATDLAILEVDQDLPSWLSMNTDESITPGLPVRLVGFPWPEKQKLHHPNIPLEQASVHSQLDSKQHFVTGKAFFWLVNFGEITKPAAGKPPKEVWSGSPVVDDGNRLVGVYSRPNPRADQSGYNLEQHQVVSIAPIPWTEPVDERDAKAAGQELR